MREHIDRLLSGGGHHTPLSYVIIFVFFSLLVGAALRGIRGRIRIPYTPILLILGVLVGIFLKHLGLFGETGTFISQIDAEGILLLFLPVLIFESSFSADWHIFKHSIYQILLLAGPGLVIAFALIAVTMKVILRYPDEDLNWTSALLFGSIVGVTDPVAIVALLKEVGAPHYFGTIIEGESLLNDGTGIAFFVIFSNLAAGKEVGIGFGVAAFIFLCSGGVLLGLAFGFFGSLWQERINKDAVLSITIIFVACYILFWISESYKVSFSSEFKVGVSGTVGLCIFGLYMAATARTVIPIRVEHPLHSVVSWAQYAAETLIFILTGLLVGQIINEKNTTIVAADWGKLIAFFFLLNGIRMVAVTILSPILVRLGYKLTLKELLVLSLSGLRGSLALALALSVDADKENFSQRTRELILLFTAGTAMLTILVNGTLLGPFIKKIKMVKKVPAKSNLFKAFIKELDKTSHETYQAMRDENPGMVCDWDVVKSVAPIANRITKKKAPNQSSNSTHEAILPSKRYSSYIVNDKEFQTETRFRLLKIFKQLVWEKYHEGKLGGHGANLLEKAVDISLDDPSSPIKVFEFLHSYFMRPKTIEIFTKLSRTPVIGSYFKKQMAVHMILIYEANVAISEVVQELQAYAGYLPLKEEITKVVLKEFVGLKEAADSYQNKLGDRFGGIMRYIMTKHCVTKLLNKQRHFIEERFKMGEIEEKEHNELISLIDKKMRKLHMLVEVKWEPPTFLSLLTGFPLFNLLSQDQLDKIAQTSKVTHFHKGQTLYEEGKSFDGIYLIRSGEVEIFFKNNHFKKGMGHVIALYNLLVPDNISQMTCIASGKVEAHKLDVKGLREMMENNDEFEEKVYRSSFNLLRFVKPEANNVLVHLSEISAKTLGNEARFVRFSQDQKIPLQNGGFVLKGEVKRKERVYNEYSAIPKGTKSVNALTTGFILQFNITERTKRQSSVLHAVEKLIE